MQAERDAYPFGNKAAVPVLSPSLILAAAAAAGSAVTNASKWREDCCSRIRVSYQRCPQLLRLLLVEYHGKLCHTI
jgi:hypothetical protein